VIFRSESYKTGIVVSTILNILGKSVVFLNALLIAYLFGSNEITDIYFYVLSIINIICGYINGVDLLVIIPESMRLRARQGEAEEMRFLNFFIRLYFLLGLLIAVLIVLAPVFFYSRVSGFADDQLERNKDLLVISALIIPMQLTTNLLVSILASHKYFSVPILVSLVNNILCIIFFLVLKTQLSISAGIVAIAFGFFINLVLLFSLFKRKLNWKFRGPVLFPSRKNWKDIFILELNLLPVYIRSSLTYFMLTSIGVGAMTTINYANQFVVIPELLILQQIAAVIGIKITELSAKDDVKGLNILFNSTMNFLMFILLPISFFIFLFAPEISHILYYRGNMDEETIRNIATCISFLILLLPAKAYCDFFVTRVITARQHLQKVIGITLIMHVIILAVIYFSIKYYGLYGYLGGIVAAYWVVSNIIFYLLLKKVAPFIEQGLFFKRTLLLLLINLIIISFLFIIKQRMNGQVSSYIVLPAGLIIYVSLLLVLNKWFRLDSTIADFQKLLMSRLGLKNRVS